ncbi:WD repeat-containing protein 26 homolog [Contarinia nasturtii]|uniref:WD repeat-containing protein 26 homolog n=1 Tax=Contarinia nasturtii TaxID=265458 RepID=UPI0012D40C9C|nr:WD repeat-containing protein 26 homolog [Contarinia nasturtii]
MQEQGNLNSNDAVNNLESNGHVLNGNTENGVTTLNNVVPVNLTKTDQDIVRLIGQYLKIVGLGKTADHLIEESGCVLEHASATKFRQYVMHGDWIKADHYLQEVQQLIERKHNNIVEMKFLLLEQKYLEYLEEGRVLEALHVLRNELTPLQYNTPRVHQLSSLMMCANSEELIRRSNWEGKGDVSRTRLIDRLQSFLPPNVMLPPRRLRSLLKQAVQFQAEKCSGHDVCWRTDLDNVSLLTDHDCGMDSFPVQTVQVLNDHCDEVWFVKFSPDGLKLASGSKDTSVIIWDVDPQKNQVKMRRNLEGHTYGISFLQWSPDSKHLLVGGPEECPNIWIWNLDEEKVPITMSHSSEDSLTCGSFSPDGQRFVTGGTRGQFYLCDLNGTVLDSWDGVRVTGLAFRSDNKTILASDTLNRIRLYAIDNPRLDCTLVQEQFSIMTFVVNSSDRLALLNCSQQGLHLWDLEDKCLVRQFQGTTQGTYTIFSCFGGINESFIASGSEDHKVYIWHIKREEPLAKLTGHTRTVNCVSWNPVYPSMLASASDDATVRIWAPRPFDSNTSNNEIDETSSCSSSSWNMT